MQSILNAGRQSSQHRFAANPNGAGKIRSAAVKFFDARISSWDLPTPALIAPVSMKVTVPTGSDQKSGPGKWHKRCYTRVAEHAVTSGGDGPDVVLGTLFRDSETEAVRDMNQMLRVSLAFSVVLALQILSTAQGAIQNSSQLAVQPPARPQSGFNDCARVCGGIRAKLKSRSKDVTAENEIWRQRLGVKSEIVTYPQGFSAAEELLRFMAEHYPMRAPGNQAAPEFLSYLMAKCFPDAYVDLDRARLTGLVETIWTAKNLKVEKDIAQCK